MATNHRITSKIIPLNRLEPQSSFRPRCVQRTLFYALALITFLTLLPRTTHAQTTDRVGICFGSGASLLIPLARHRDFYAAEGITADMLPFASGKQAMEAMFGGKCALAVAAETPVVHHSLSRNDFSIISAVAISSNFERIIARSDRGILSPANLSGHRIAVTEFTTAHYYLDMYLAANGLAQQDVSKVYLPAQEVGPAFLRGEVDAAAHWEPNIQKLATEFGARAKVFTSPGLHVSPFLLIGNRDYIRKNPASIEKVLRALLRAERWAKEQPANARVLVARDNEGSAEELELIFSLNDFRVRLDQSLLFILENTARWEIGLMPQAQRPTLPNYLDFIYVDGLKAVKPEAITIIR